MERNMQRNMGPNMGRNMGRNLDRNGTLPPFSWSFVPDISAKTP
jgi:hypothetical protein